MVLCLEISAMYPTELSKITMTNPSKTSATQCGNLSSSIISKHDINTSGIYRYRRSFKNKNVCEQHLNFVIMKRLQSFIASFLGMPVPVPCYYYEYCMSCPVSVYLGARYGQAQQIDVPSHDFSTQFVICSVAISTSKRAFHLFAQSTAGCHWWVAVAITFYGQFRTNFKRNHQAETRLKQILLWFFFLCSLVVITGCAHLCEQPTRRSGNQIPLAFHRFLLFAFLGLIISMMLFDVGRGRQITRIKTVLLNGNDDEQLKIDLNDQHNWVFMMIYTKFVSSLFVVVPLTTTFLLDSVDVKKKFAILSFSLIFVFIIYDSRSFAYSCEMCVYAHLEVWTKCGVRHFMMCRIYIRTILLTKLN